MSQVRPTGVKADREARTVTITWSDGHVSDYSFAGLRAVCPCVTCKGGHAHMGAPPDPHQVRSAQDESLNLENVEAVGGYALQFSWSDGHSTGIYTWEYLRQACPCAECLPDSD
jgi:DUF971 family protein